MTALDGPPTVVAQEDHVELCRLLVHEAALLDQRRFDDWLELLTDDMTYRIPVRVTAELRAGDVVDDMSYFEEEASSLATRLSRFGTQSAWAEDPPSRTRHFVSNVVTTPADRAGEVAVTSYLMFTRCRGDDPTVDILTGRRDDLWRSGAPGWRLARREVCFDQTVLGTLNLSTIY